MNKIGYMRVSTEEQDHALQKQALEHAGCSSIYQDTISGSTPSRTGLTACLAALAPGDTLLVWKLDRLGRSASHLFSMIEGLAARGVNFTTITEGLDTTTIHGRGMFGMMAVFAQMEKETIQLRVKAGLAARKSRGGKLGPPFKVSDTKAAEILHYGNEGCSQRWIAQKTGISQPTVSRILGRIKME